MLEMDISVKSLKHKNFTIVLVSYYIKKYKSINWYNPIMPIATHKGIRILIIRS